MNEQQARIILADCIITNDRLITGSDGEHIDYDPMGSVNIELDGTFSLTKLEAIVWWINHKHIGKL